MSKLFEIKQRIEKGERVVEGLNEAKLLMSQSNLLIPSTRSDMVDLQVSRDILEVGALHSITSQDLKSFERYINLLNPFWSLTNDSTNQPKIIALQLLIYLTQNRISDFHTLLESIPIHLLSNFHIQTPIKLERWIMEGSYSKVWDSKPEIELAGHWIWLAFLETIRNEIASCEEKAYDSLPINDAATLLFFNSPAQLTQFATSRGWTISPSTQHVIFKDLNSITGIEKQKFSLPSHNMISHSLNYAKELETIV
ncbi:26S proteasome non-ATPase regulatory subunit 8 [Wallemia ichthyophaga EXF-994]|uniref:26S proteasome non-ATPase regulatory subunit 8 n=1 Tax=Wallemia ichthyophaga (strain EXF-994 / CBS 113033) TaxID=1299270 RepID=R9AEH4_WALI9|nr:26S proteasome non-ATPase regulatory subunit 8 [Wallemia ichthyophaga EXF-994]EOR00573.1 26S proteasome non-ATPase regulatory subunit 8 [Wallemia ichthyophaga EXF-994]